MLPYLKYFYQAAVSGTFSRAAEALYISQPALSRQITSLEEKLGLKLFHRQARNLVLTDAGRRLLGYTENILELNRQACKELQELKDLTKGDLAVGASTTAACYLLPPVLAEYRQQHPGIRLNLKIGNYEEIEQATLNHRIDLGLTAGQVENSGLFQEKLADDELCLVVSSVHPLGHSTKEFSLDMLSKETILCQDPGSDSTRLFQELLGRAGVTPSCAMTLGHPEAVKRGIIHNAGVAYLSRHAFQNEWKLGSLVPLNKYRQKRPVNLLYLKNSRLSPAALMFSAAVKKFFNSP